MLCFVIKMYSYIQGPCLMTVGSFANTESFSIYELIFSIFYNSLGFFNIINFSELSKLSEGQISVIYKFDAFWHAQVGFLFQTFDIKTLRLTMRRKCSFLNPFAFNVSSYAGARPSFVYEADN